MILQCDPLASGTILRKSQYQEFVLPYAKKVNQAIHDAGGMVCYHICGDTTKTIDDMADAGCDLSGQVKLENIEAFMNAARKYGKWPLDPKNFE